MDGAALPSGRILQGMGFMRASTPAGRRKLAIAITLLIASGSAAACLYPSQGLFRGRRRRPSKERGHGAGPAGGKEGDPAIVAAQSRAKKKGRGGGARAVRALVALLLAEMGEGGLRSLLAMAGMSVLRTALSNRLAQVQGFLFRAAFLRRVPLFARLIAENLLLCLAQSVIVCSARFLHGSLALRWRRILTERVHADYFPGLVFYKMSHVDKRISAPEQRLASDVPAFSLELAELLQENLGALADALFYTVRLCSYTSPRYALGILAYVLGAGAVTTALSPPFGKLLAEEQQREGEYRQLHSRLRTHAESIAFYGGEEREAQLLQHRFQRLIQHVHMVLHTQWWFGVIQDFFLKYCGATWAVVLIIGPFFGGELRAKPGLVGRADMLSRMRYHTSVVITLFQAMGTLASSTRRLSRLSGYAERIRDMMHVGRELRSLTSSAGGGGGSVEEASYIEFEGVTVVTPAGNVLVEDLSLRVDRGTNLLITGPNGSGKSSLFRVLGGLWPLVAGRIAKPGRPGDLSHDIFYVPQRPYMAVGTLIDQLVYPLTRADLATPLSEEQMRAMLAIVDLEGLLTRYPQEAEVNWGEELSLGEQQRLGMVRLFYHAPQFAILDECTSAVTTELEERFCARVRAMGVTCVTISHRPAMVAFHDTVLALDGEGGWTVHHKSRTSEADPELESSTFVQLEADLPEGTPATLAAGLTQRRKDATTNQRLFVNAGSAQRLKGSLSYVGDTIRRSPPPEPGSMVPHVPLLHPGNRSLAQRSTTLARVLMPRLAGQQGGQLAALFGLVVARTLLSDRIASLNGATVANVLEQDRAAFVRLVAVSVLQSSLSAVIAPTLRHLSSSLAVGWRCRLTEHLCSLYFCNNAFYKAGHLAQGLDDADARISADVDKLCRDLAGLTSGLVKPLVDIAWFTWRMRVLTGQRGVAILYCYMLVGLGFLRAITPDFGALTSEEQRLEGAFRYAHERLRVHAESVAFFGGGAREQTVIAARFRAIVQHRKVLLRQRWLFGIADEFITKQLPHNVTWLLSLLYALEAPTQASLAEQGRLAHDLRFLASVVSQSFLAFGDILELYRKTLEVSGGVQRVTQLAELLTAAQPDVGLSPAAQAQRQLAIAEDAHLARSQSREILEGELAFQDVDVVTPGQKLLARKLTLRVQPGRSLLVTGPNGSGKSSLFRVLGGLWPLASGCIAKPGCPPMTSAGPTRLPTARESRLSHDIFYVPQRPYTALGTLRDQLIYPLSHADAAMKLQLQLQGEDSKISGITGQQPLEASLAALDRQLRSILEAVRLVYLLEREGGWEANANWQDMLSLGEQQRLGMARLFFQSPKFGILDECTNATSVDVEESLYRRAQAAGITVVTISQRPALIPFHAAELRLIDGEGAWELRSIQSTSTSQQ